MFSLFVLVLLTFYLVVAFRLCLTWLEFIRQDTPAPTEMFLSWVVLGVATVLWPLVIPFAYLQVLQSKLEKKTANSYTFKQYREVAESTEVSASI
jgi:hypothetical protein